MVTSYLESPDSRLDALSIGPQGHTAHHIKNSHYNPYSNTCIPSNLSQRDQHPLQCDQTDCIHSLHAENIICSNLKYGLFSYSAQVDTARLGVNVHDVIHKPCL